MGAELVCNDGTVINISDETEQELRKVFGEKTYPVGTWFYRDFPPHFVKLVEIRPHIVAFRGADVVLMDGKITCWGEIKVNNIQEIPFSIIQKLTGYPKGLRPVKVKIVED